MQWDLGDGSLNQGAALSVTHSYAQGGYYLVTLTMTSGDGQVAVVRGGVSLGDGNRPLASDDAFSTDRNVAITITTQELLSNDAPGVRFEQGSAKCLVPPGGSACTYTPPANFPQDGFVGTDTFTYSVTDASTNNHDTATVSVTVTKPLVALPDEFTTSIGVPILISSDDLLLNDSRGAVFVTAENPVDGTLELVETNGSQRIYRFTPSPGFAGQAGFEYVISWDGNSPFETGVVTVEVVDAPPVAMFDFSYYPPNPPPRTFTVHPRSTDDVGIVRWIWDFGDGIVIEPGAPDPAADQTHTYAHSGRYVITHTVFDTSEHSDDFQREVTANVAPVAVPDTATTERDIPVVVQVLANDTDFDGDSLVIYTVVAQHPGAAVAPVQTPAGWAVRFTPPDSFVGTTTFDYTTSDPWGGSSTARATVTVNQWTSITDARGEQFYCNTNTPLPIPVSLLQSNDYDSDGDPLTIVATDTSILMGTLDCTTNPSTCTYQPPSGGWGQTFFRYTVSDPAGHRDTATVRLYVGTRGTPPTLVDDYFSTLRNTPVSFTVQDVVQNDVDVNGDTIQVTLSSGAKGYGSLSCTSPMYKCTYTPNAGFVGTDHFLYNGTDTVNPGTTAYINSTTLPPTTPTFDAREELYLSPMSQTYIPKTFLTQNDYDPEHDPISVASIDSTGLMGTLTCDSAGCTFKPPIGFSGRTSFKYTATDGHGSTDTAIVRIRVGSANAVPVPRTDAYSTPKNTQLKLSVFDLLRNDYDPDNDPLAVAVYGGAQKGTMSCGNPQYWCTYTPNANVTGTDTITYSINDGSGAVTSSLTITIQP
jgi:large repetitive protein